MLKRRKRKRKSLWSVPDTTRWCGCCKKRTTFTFNRIIRHSECTNCGWRKIIVMDRKTTYTDEELDEMKKEDTAINKYSLGKVGAVGLSRKGKVEYMKQCAAVENLYQGSVRSGNITWGDVNVAHTMKESWSKVKIKGGEFV